MTLLIKIAVISAFLVQLLAICKLIQTISSQRQDFAKLKESFAKLKESNNRALAELNAHEQEALARVEYDYEC